MAKINRFYFSLLIIYPCLFLSACATNKKSEDSRTTSQEQEKIVVDQSISAPKPLPPNTAKVSAVVVDHKEKTNQYLCSLKIQRVHAYGASTPAMAVGTEITAIIPQSVLEDIENISEFFKSGKSMDISLRHQVRMITEREVPSWMVVQIH